MARCPPTVNAGSNRFRWLTALLAELEAAATVDRFVYRHRWEAGDIVMWDNRTTLHRLLPYDIANERRIMRRITVTGTERVVPA